jgi:hypothetical protein
MLAGYKRWKETKFEIVLQEIGVVTADWIEDVQDRFIGESVRTE